MVIHKFWDDSIILPNTINPYAWVNLIEEINSEITEKGEDDTDNYDIIMDALWWVVENYLEKKMTKTEKQEEIEKVISKVERSEWTIDLR